MLKLCDLPHPYLSLSPFQASLSWFERADSVIMSQILLPLSFKSSPDSPAHTRSPSPGPTCLEGTCITRIKSRDRCAISNKTEVRRVSTSLEAKGTLSRYRRKHVLTVPFPVSNKTYSLSSSTAVKLELSPC